MRTIDVYLDAAIKSQKLANDSELAEVLNITKSALSAYRRRKAWPAPETMIKLARFAGIEEQVALIELAFMSAPDGSETKAAYEKLIKRLGATAAAIVILTFANVPSALASSDGLHRMNAIVYYGKYKKLYFRFIQYIKAHLFSIFKPIAC